ncbi:unnamed protein product [Rotaria sordida]|uniref:Uncharacterized protein n=1 Tax=Rotaria sordida TaxID=392033 RepID=A0A818ZDD8_9BILA|nr:unnamed protein product [Rotaria sordida]
MVSKTQPVIPPTLPTVHLETIYEESGDSHSSSIVNIQRQFDNREQSSSCWSNQTFHGLISARSIPTVDVHRRRQENDCQHKPPIEVRYLDGTKCYIHPSLTTTTASTIIKRRKYSRSSRHDSSSPIKINTKSRQIFNITPKKKKKLPKKPEIMLTIITVEDLSQAGITPPSTSSLDESDTLALTKSHSNSSVDTLKAVKDISLNDTDKVLIEQLPTATVPPSIQPVGPIIDITMSNLRFPVAPRHHSQHQPTLRHPQQTSTIRSQSLPPSQSHFPSSLQQKSISNLIPPVAVVPPSRKTSGPSLQITVTTDENERNLLSINHISRSTISSMKSTNENLNNQSKPSFQSCTNSLVGGGSRSAFRPFLKSTTFTPQPKLPLNMNVKSQTSTNQIKQNSSKPQVPLPSHPHPQQYRPSSSSNKINFTAQHSSSINSVGNDRHSISSDVSKQSVRPKISNNNLSDKVINSTSTMRTSNNSQPLLRTSTNKIVDNSFNQTNIINDQMNDIQNRSIIIDPSLQWHSVTSKSLYEVPRLSNQYSGIPLRITLPDSSPTHNQKLVHNHDIELENRLLNAGLSPETIALYERILEVGDINEMAISSPPEIINQYHCESFL